MPGEFDWLAVGRRGNGTVSLAAMMELFAREEAFADLSGAGCDSLPTLFAAYVGSEAEVMPAFNGAVGAVRADNFVTRRTPPIAWISADGVDPDIAAPALSAVRAAQIVRRMVLAGNLYAARGDEKKAVETWARAAARTPGDSLIVERLCRLDVNGRVFLQLGKAAMAARCYETMAQIRPDDPVPVRRYGECLQKLGKNDIARRAFARARAIETKNRKGKERAK
jgi:tetratricopeptide (TPR) repeat protein